MYIDCHTAGEIIIYMSEGKLRTFYLTINNAVRT